MRRGHLGQDLIGEPFRGPSVIDGFGADLRHVRNFFGEFRRGIDGVDAFHFLFADRGNVHVAAAGRGIHHRVHFVLSVFPHICVSFLFVVGYCDFLETLYDLFHNVIRDADFRGASHAGCRVRFDGHRGNFDGFPIGCPVHRDAVNHQLFPIIAHGGNNGVAHIAHGHFGADPFHHKVKFLRAHPLGCEPQTRAAAFFRVTDFRILHHAGLYATVVIFEDRRAVGDASHPDRAGTMVQNFISEPRDDRLFRGKTDIDAPIRFLRIRARDGDGAFTGC